MSYYRPLQFGLATLEEIRRMDTEELHRLNSIAIQMEKEQAETIAVYVAKIFSPPEDNSEAGIAERRAQSIAEKRGG